MSHRPVPESQPHLESERSAVDAATREVVVDAVFQDGVIKPLSPLDLPPDVPVRLRVAFSRASSADAVQVVVEEPLPAPARSTATDGVPADRSTGPAQPRLLILLLLSLLLAGLGQFILRTSYPASEFPWPGVAVYLGAMLAFWGATLVARQPVFPAESAGPAESPVSGLAALWRVPWRLALLALAVVCMLVLLYVLQLEPPLPGYNRWALLWIGAIGFLLGAFVWLGQATESRSTRPWWRDWRLVLGVSAIVLLALVLRVWQLGSIPPTLGGDEGSQGLEAIRVIEGQIRNPFTTGWLGVPTMSFYFNALSIMPMGNTMEALRLPWALVGTTTVLVVFLLVHRLCGVTPGLLTAGLLATYHYHIHFSRLGSNQVADTLFVALALLFFYRGYDRRSPFDWALCGVTVGVSQYFYAGARFTAIIIITMVIFFLVRDRARFWREHRAGVLVLGMAMLLVAAPMIQYAVRFPDAYNARVNEVGIVQSGWLEREQAIRNQGALPILIDQFQRAALAFNYYPDRTLWYGSPRPLFGFVAAALFVLGFSYSLLHLHDRRFFPMVAWWGGAMILGGVLTESPPSSQRLITMAAPAVFFVSLALVLIGRLLLQAVGTRRPRLLAGYLGASALLLALLSVKWYFLDFTPLRVYGNYNAVVATSIGKYARDELGPDWRMVFFGAPRMYIDFGTIPYLAPDVPRTDVLEPLTAPPDWDLAALDANVAFVFLPERIDELDLVRQTYPGGTLTVVPPPPPFEHGDPLYTIYRVSG